jgi:hypothetical protein
MISTKLAYRISLAAGLFALVVVFIFRAVPIHECGTVPSSAVVISAELARTQADLDAIFAPAPGQPCTHVRGHDLFTQTMIDTVAFIPAYGVFLVFFFLAMVPREEYAAFAGFTLTIVAVLADYVENICLFHIANNPYAAGWALAAIPWATGVKWLLLGLAGAFGGLILIRSGRVNYPAALACFLGLLGPVLAIANPHLFKSFAAGTALALIAFLVVVARGAFSAVPELEVQDGAG